MKYFLDMADTGMQLQGRMKNASYEICWHFIAGHSLEDIITLFQRKAVYRVGKGFVHPFCFPVIRMPDSWYNNTRKGCVDMELKALRISEKGRGSS